MSDDRPARIAQLKAEIAERQAELVRLSLEYAAELAGLSGDERERFIGLTSKHNSDTLNTVDASTSDLARSRARMRPRTRKHPAAVAFAEKGDTIGSAAQKLGYHRNTVQAWMRTDEYGRGIPEAAVAKIKELYGVPRSAWARIIP